MNKYVFSIHARYKFIFFKAHGIKIKPQQVVAVVKSGKITDISALPNVETTGVFDAKHSLVVIYRQTKTGYFVITFWIAEKGRYESKIQ